MKFNVPPVYPDETRYNLCRNFLTRRRGDNAIRVQTNTPAINRVDISTVVSTRLVIDAAT